MYVIWDIDDTLNDFMKIWLSINYQSINFDTLTKNPSYGLLGIDKEAYISSLDEFREKYYMYLAPNERVINWFKNNGKYIDSIALTASPVTNINTVSSWLFKHFGTWFRTFHFVPSERLNIDYPRYENTKADFIRQLQRRDIIFIDDKEDNIEVVKEIGVEVYCVKQPWNSGDSMEDILNQLTTRIKNGY